MSEKKITTQSESHEKVIVDFLALFNQIDKHLDKILGEEKFLPYNEKIKRLVHEQTYIMEMLV